MTEQPISAETSAEYLAARILRAPALSDSKQARDKLSDLVGRAQMEPQAAALLPHLENAAFRDLMLGIADHSPFLWQLALVDPARLARLATTAPERVHRELVGQVAHLYRRPDPISQQEAAREFRRARAAHALLVALADIGGLWTVDEVTQALSDFADASVAGAVNLLLLEAAGTGKIRLADLSNPGEGSGFVVLALGKHGAGELNYSSDIDLVVFFDPQTPALADRDEAGTFYSRLARNLSKLLQERTADGYVHRVDYRLRPDPGSTPVAVSLPAAYTYYETVGQNWERAALIKARPVAGERALGDRFLGDLVPFIWRKYFSTLR